MCDRCLVADTPLSRLRGLLGRRELGDGEGLLLTPASAVHTWFMRFPIDVVFLEADLTILGTREHVKPWRMTGWRGARSVLELPPGSCRRHRIHPGGKLTLGDDPGEGESAVLVLRRDSQSKVVLGPGPLSAVTRTISAVGELDVGVSAVVLRSEDDPDS
jgi:uncharacterized protein